MLPVSRPPGEAARDVLAGMTCRRVVGGCGGGAAIRQRTAKYCNLCGVWASTVDFGKAFHDYEGRPFSL